MKLFKHIVRQKSLGILYLFFCAVSIHASAEDISRADQTGNADSLYVFEPLEVRGKMIRDVIKQPLTESSGLELSTTVLERSDIARQGAKTVIDAIKLGMEEDQHARILEDQLYDVKNRGELVWGD